MRIGLVAQPYDGVLPPQQNSIGLIIYNTALELGGKSDVDIILKTRPDLPDTAEFPFRVHCITTPWHDALDDARRRYPRWARRFGLDTRDTDYRGYARAVARATAKLPLSVIHVMNYWQWSRCLRKPGRPLVLEMQCEWLAQMDKDQVRRQLDATAAVVGVSDHIADQFRQSFPDYGGLVITAYNGVDVSTFAPPDAATTASGHRDSRTVLFVGRTSPEKGIHVLLAAFEEVVRRCPDARLEIAGPRSQLPLPILLTLSDDPRVQALREFYDGTLADDYQQYLGDLVNKLGLARQVRFLGSLPHHDLVASYQSASVVVNPSFSESFGISIVEGMAAQAPVVGTRIGGMKETIVNGENGWLVEPDRPDALADAILRLLEDPAGARRMGEAGRTRAAATFSWRARASRLLALYQETMENDAD